MTASEQLFKSSLSYNRKITSNKTIYLEIPKKLDSLATKDFNFSQEECILQVMTNIKTCLFINKHLIH